MANAQPVKKFRGFGSKMKDNFTTKNTALMIIDMQNAFCSKKGSFLKRGYSILNLERVLNNIQKLISFARKNNFLVVFTKLAFKKDYSDAGLLVKRVPEIIKLGAYREDGWDSKITKNLKIQKEDIIIIKKRHDPFIGTNLERILRKNKIKKIIVTGLLTNVCVESCVRSAFDRDFEVVVVKDAISTYSKKLYDSSLDNTRRHFAETIFLDELVNKFKKK